MLLKLRVCGNTTPIPQITSEEEEEALNVFRVRFAF